MMLQLVSRSVIRSLLFPSQSKAKLILVGYEKIFAQWQAFIDHLEKMDLMDAPSIKPIIDGKKLAKVLGEPKMGEWMREALLVCMEWQLRNPGVADAQGAVEEVIKRREELKIPMK